MSGPVPGMVRSSMRSTAAAGPASFISFRVWRDAPPPRCRGRWAAYRPPAHPRTVWTRGSSGMDRHPGIREPTHGPGRPAALLEVQAVNREQRHGQSVDTEGDAAGVGQFALVVVDAPHLAEVLAVVVEAHARGGRRRRDSTGSAVRNFASACSLTHGHDLPDPAEKRICSATSMVNGRPRSAASSAGALGHPASRGIPGFPGGSRFSRTRAHPKGLRSPGHSCATVFMLERRRLRCRIAARPRAAGRGSPRWDRRDSRPPGTAPGPRNSPRWSSPRHSP